MNENTNRQLSELIGVLHEMDLVAKKAVNFGKNGDDTGVRTNVDHLRLIQYRLSNIDVSFLDAVMQDPGSGDKLLSLMKVKNDIKKSYEFIASWVHRYRSILSDDDLMSTREGMHAHIDSTIPLNWNFKSDIIFLCGNYPEAYIECLHERGQKKVIIFSENLNNNSIGQNCGYLTINSVNQLGSIASYVGRMASNKFVMNFYNDNVDRLALENKIRLVFETALINLNTINFFEKRWITQGIENLNDLAIMPSWNILSSKIKFDAAVIVSPGPSLDRNIKQLSNFKDAAYIICVAQALPALIKNGIYPDLVTVIDPVDYSHILNNIDIDRRSDLLIGCSCNKNFRKHSFREAYYFDGNQIADRWIFDIFDDVPIGASGGSVSVSSLLFAIACKFKYITLVGQDLSISGNNQYSVDVPQSSIKVEISEGSNIAHISGYTADDFESFSADEMAVLNKQSIQLPSTDFDPKMNGKVFQTELKVLPGYYEGEVLSPPDYYQFHQQFCAIAKNIKNDVYLFNSTEGGANIPGYANISLADFLLKYNSKRLTCESQSLFDNKSRLSKLSNFFLSSKSSLLEIINISDEIIRIIDESLLANSSDNNLFLLKSKESKLLTAVEGLPFINLGIQKEMDVVLKNIMASSSLLETLKHEQNLVLLIKDWTLEVFSLLEKESIRFNFNHCFSGSNETSGWHD